MRFSKVSILIQIFEIETPVRRSSAYICQEVIKRVKKMRKSYTRDVYLKLANKIRTKINKFTSSKTL
jgi:hypothetical protein